MPRSSDSFELVAATRRSRGRPESPAGPSPTGDAARIGCGSAVSATGGERQDMDFSSLPAMPYAYLLGLYLGDGCISASHRDVYRMRIVLDSSYPGIIAECCAALEALFPQKSAHAGKRPTSNCVEVSMCSKHWPCFFPQHGPGRKHLRPIRLAAWQGRSSMRITGLSSGA